MNCTVCCRKVVPVLDLGEQALAGAFLKPERFDAEVRYPLRVGFCPSCYSVQVIDRVDRERIFGDYFYRSSTSATMRDHFKRYAAELVERFAPKSVAEVGCNDGAMALSLVDGRRRVVGIDPNAGPTLPGVEVWRSYFSEHAAKRIGKVDLVVANNVFAHVEDVHGFLRGVRAMLAPNGVFAFEVHYLGAVLDGQYDAIYHEHVFYHSLISLQKLLGMWGLEVFDVQPVGVHGGSMRYYAAKFGERAETSAVGRLRAEELRRRFDEVDTYERLQVQMLDHRRQLCGLMNRLDRERVKVAGYGAAGRANTLLQWCGIESLAYVVDDCPEKHGFHTPGTHIEIRPPSALEEDRPDWLMVLAWPYLREIRERVVGFHGNVIVPLPKVNVHRFYVYDGQRLVA